jgi:hypothetical protein
MSRQTSNNEEFIPKAKRVHGNKYDYSILNYTNANNKVRIICPIHGVFEQIAFDHLDGHGCMICGGSLKKTREQFISEAKKVHSKKFNYSKLEYSNTNEKVKIICKVHGVFEQTAKSHLAGYGCWDCSRVKVSTTDKFSKKAKEVHNNRYDYSEVVYINNATKVKIKCHEHGIFEQTPNNHLRGKNCPSCAGNKRIIKKEIPQLSIVKPQLTIVK